MSGNGTPKWELSSAINRGQEAMRLVERYATPLESRLSAGLREHLAEELGKLAGTPADRRAKLTEQKGKTGTERELASDLLDWVMQVRELAKRTRGVSEGMLKSLGVGEPVSASSTNAVQAAAKAVFDTMGGNGEVSRQLGLVPADLEEGQGLVEALAAADAAQRGTVSEGKDKTFDKNAAQLEVEAGVDEVSSRGVMAFRKEPQVRALFEALVSSSGPKPKASGAPTPPTT